VFSLGLETAFVFILTPFSVHFVPWLLRTYSRFIQSGTLTSRARPDHLLLLVTELNLDWTRRETHSHLYPVVNIPGEEWSRVEFRAGLGLWVQLTTSSFLVFKFPCNKSPWDSELPS